MSDAFGVPGVGQDLCSMLRMRAKHLALAANTLAGGQVQTSRNAPLTGDRPFFVSIFTPKIKRTLLGDSPATFMAKVSLVVIGKVTGSTLAEAEVFVDTLRVQLENALLSSAGFWFPPLEKVTGIETVIEFPGDDETHLGFVTMVIDCQCTDSFGVPTGPQLETIQVTVPNATMPSGNLPADNLIGAIITLPGA